MLENTVWRQYHKENTFRERLAEYCVLDSMDLIVEDKELYGILKAKLTKKELKLFAMDSAKISDDKLQVEFSYNDKELEKAKFKLYKKLKQDKTRLEFKESSRDRQA
ncbi:hypothetical protein JHD46_02695 [Sulfurimonas sp. SAG-AH-194-C20]|nr:hypothetical protein [Sulfurimonas sp. SAG-AH-194-C20]MDF1878545.1 hypothetical protein [Sulfurimonas sp. SAG-AH-194-C20]